MESLIDNPKYPESSELMDRDFETFKNLNKPESVTSSETAENSNRKKHDLMNEAP